MPLRYVVFNGPHCGGGLFFYAIKEHDDRNLFLQVIHL